MNEPQASMSHPSHDEFAALLEESLKSTALQEGSVIKGTIVAIENDLAMIDVGLKTEGRIPLKEFGVSGRPADINVGDEVDVYLERVENAPGRGRAVAARRRAAKKAGPGSRRNTSRPARRRRDLQPRQGRLHRRSRRRRGLPARQPSRYPPDARRRPADEPCRSRSRS